MKPLETSRFALIRSYANTMPTLCANSDLMCLKGTGEIGSGGKKREENFFPGSMIEMVKAS